VAQQDIQTGRECARLGVVFELVQDAGALYMAGRAVDVGPHHARRVLAQRKDVVRKHDDLVTSRLHCSGAELLCSEGEADLRHVQQEAL